MQAALPMGGNKVTGTADPTVPTDVATKNYVDTATGAFFSTGDIKLTLKSTPDTGWLMFDDGTFGSASSGSSNSNNVANLALFTLLFNAPFTDANVPLLTSGGGATTRAAQVSASAAWAANCRMSLPKTLGRALGIAGAGSGLTARVLGQFLGEETHLLVAGEIPGITVGGTITVNPNGDTGLFVPFPAGRGGGSNNFINLVGTGSITVPSTGTSGWSYTATFSSTTNTMTSTNTGGGVHNNMQPSSYLNAMVKV